MERTRSVRGPRRAPFVVLGLSVVMLVAVLITWRGAASAPPRADLVDGPRREPVAPTTSTPPAPTTTAAGPRIGRPFAASAASPPVRLRIPSIGVDVRVGAVGLLPDGRMEVPSAVKAGWFSPGVHPAAPFGSSVLAAHIDYGGRAGAFFRLREVQVGDAVTLVLADGTAHDFRVSDRSQVAKTDLPTGELFRRTGPQTLTLITCGGEFDASRRHYRDNIVVRAVPAPSDTPA